MLSRSLPISKEDLVSINPGHFAFLVELVGIAKLRPSLQLVRWGIMHRDRYTRMAALKTAIQLKDDEAVPYIITRLDDPSPGVQRQALRQDQRLAQRPYPLQVQRQAQLQVQHLVQHKTTGQQMGVIVVKTGDHHTAIKRDAAGVLTQMSLGFFAHSHHPSIHQFPHPPSATLPI